MHACACVRKVVSKSQCMLVQNATVPHVATRPRTFVLSAVLGYAINNGSTSTSVLNVTNEAVRHHTNHDTVTVGMGGNTDAAMTTY